MNQPTQFLVRVQAEAFKNIKVIDFIPNRYVTQISGANGAGKTSALDLIFQGLAPRKTLSPTLIRQGQKKGYIRIETNTHIITRKLDEKGGTLQIEQKGTNTLVKAPDDWLEGIAGELGFDPLKFMRLKPEDQFTVLKALVTLEADIDDLELRNETDAETITKRKAEARRLEAARDHINVDKTLAEKPIDIEAILSEARAIGTFNSNIDQQRRERATEDGVYAAAKLRIEELRERHDRLSAELLQVSRDMDALRVANNEREEKIKARQPLPDPKDRTELDERVTAASTTNARISANNAAREQHADFDSQVDGIRDELKKLEESIRDRKLKIGRALEHAKFPVEGLSFETVEEGSGGRERKNPKKIVTYKGIPLSDASSAEQIRVSTAIGMAGKPDLRFLLIREGSLLDDTNMAVLEEMAHEHSYQILMEVVDVSGKVGIFLEDGQVKAINAEPDKPAPAKVAAKKATGNKAQRELIK